MNKQINGVLGGNRTHDLKFRKLTLYPTGLQGHVTILVYNETTIITIHKIIYILSIYLRLYKKLFLFCH